MRRVKFAGNTEDIHVRCELGLIRAIDRFRFANPVIVSRPAAIRHLIRSALSSAGAADSAGSVRRLPAPASRLMTRWRPMFKPHPIPGVFTMLASIVILAIVFGAIAML